MSSQAFRHSSRFRAPSRLGDLTGIMLAPALKARGFASLEILRRWDDLVGPGFAGRCRALQLKWPARGRKSDPEGPAGTATLIVAAEAAAALELQYAAPQLIERVNAMLGWNAVGRLALRQQPVAKPKAPVRRELPLNAAEQGRIDAVTGAVEDENLRRALQQLGKGVIQRNKLRQGA